MFVMRPPASLTWASIMLPPAEAAEEAWLSEAAAEAAVREDGFPGTPPTLRGGVLVMCDMFEFMGVEAEEVEKEVLEGPGVKEGGVKRGRREIVTEPEEDLWSREMLGMISIGREKEVRLRMM